MKRIIFIALLLTLGISMNFMKAEAGPFSSYPFTSTLSNGDYFPTVTGGTNKNVNWSQLKELMSAGINWQDVHGSIGNGPMNWSDIQQVQKTSNGVNWMDLDPRSGGINWFVVANGATSAQIMCWKANGQPGKCTTGVSGTGCTGCN